MNYTDIDIIIDGVRLPSPVSVEFSYEDLDSEDSLRDVKTGTMHRARIAHDKLSLSIEYGLNSPEDLQLVLQALSPVQFTLNWMDFHTLQRKNYTCYCAKKQPKLICAGGVWINGLKFTITEC